MKKGDLVQHRVVPLGMGIVVRVEQAGAWAHGPGDTNVYILWSKHKDLGPVLEIPQSLELINESR